MENSKRFKKYSLEFEHADDAPYDDFDKHNVTAFDKEGNDVGRFDWDIDTGAIDVEVDKKHQRKGIATAMYKFAKKKSKDHDIQKPLLNRSRYGHQGLAWARSLGYKGGHNNRLDDK